MSEEVGSREATETFGLCPRCHKMDGAFNLEDGKGEWYFCRDHRLAWYAADFRGGPPNEVLTVAEAEALYEEVEPYYPPNPPSAVTAGRQA